MRKTSLSVGAFGASLGVLVGACAPLASTTPATSRPEPPAAIGGAPAARADTIAPATARVSADSARLAAALGRYGGYGLSATVGFQRGGSGPVSLAVGSARPGVEMQTDVVFESGSLTKTVTAAAILLLRRRGRLALEDSLHFFWPSLPHAVGAITIHQLLTHTSGLPENWPDAIVTDSVPRGLAEVTPAARPGEEWEYSNLGYTVLAALVEQRSGAGFETFARRELFAQLDEADLGFLPGTSWAPDRMALGGSGPLGSGRITRRHEPAPHPRSMRGATGLVASVPALLRWARALHDGTVIGRTQAEAMFAEYPPEIGYGWFHLERDGVRIIAHGGDTKGFQTYLAHVPSDDLAYALAINDRLGWRGAVIDAVHAVLLDDSMPRLPPAVQTSEQPLPEGTYLPPASDADTIFAQVEDGGLRVRAVGQGAIDLLVGADATTARRLRERSAASLRFLEAVVAGDSTRLREAIVGGQDRIASFRRIWDAALDGRPAPAGIRIVGTVPDRAGRAVTYARLAFDDGRDATVRLVWRPHLDGWGTGGDVPSRRFLPVAGDGLVSFDPVTRSWTRLDVRRSDDGTVRLLGHGGEAVLRQAG